MPNAQRLPRKYLSNIQQAQEDLRLVAKQARSVLGVLEKPNPSPEKLVTLLQEIESNAYRIALGLADLRVTDDCTGCPCAPANTPVRVHLLVLADELERQAELARQMASPVMVELMAQDESVPLLVEKVVEFSHVEFPLSLMDGE